MPHLSVQEYIERELESAAKYEYHDGQIYALAGGTLNHGLLCGNVYSELRKKLERNGSSCLAMSSEIRLFIESRNSYVYPDAMVICGDIEKSKEEVNSVMNPLLIVEVYSLHSGMGE
ncbi:MAG: Uma2 family endonuclease [Bacteroidota bacterium]